ncbi:MAG: MFS transporter [Steroidobacteraceae bacterium]
MIGTTIEFFDFYIYATAAVYLILQMIGVLFFALTIPISAIIADRIGGRRMLILATLAIIAFGFTFAPLFGAHDTVRVFFFLALGFSLTGFTYGPLGSALAALFPTAVRYTGTSLAFNLAGIVGASAAPYLATRLASDFGVSYVGYYLSGAGLLTLIALKLVGTRADHGVQPARESS